MRHRQECPSVGFWNGCEHTILIGHTDDPRFVLVDLHRREFWHISYFSSPVEPNQKGAKRGQEISARLRGELAVREPKRPILQDSIGDLMNAVFIKEREVTTGLGHSLQLAEIAWRECARSGFASSDFEPSLKPSGDEIWLCLDGQVSSEHFLQASLLGDLPTDALKQAAGGVFVRD
jgi:hypothetical protein